MRIDLTIMGSPVVGQLSDPEFRAWLALLTYVSRWRGECDQTTGGFPWEWYRNVEFSKPRSRGRVTRRQVEKFIAFGLLEPLVDGAGKRWLRVVNWRDLKPAAWDWTRAQRQERWRERHGHPATYGRRQILAPTSPDSTHAHDDDSDAAAHEDAS